MLPRSKRWIAVYDESYNGTKWRSHRPEERLFFSFRSSGKLTHRYMWADPLWYVVTLIITAKWHLRHEMLEFYKGNVFLWKRFDLVCVIWRVLSCAYILCRAQLSEGNGFLPIWRSVKILTKRLEITSLKSPAQEVARVRARAPFSHEIVLSFCCSIEKA